MASYRFLSTTLFAFPLFLILAGCGDSTTAALSTPPPSGPPSVSADVVIYCASPSGIMAAIEAARLGKEVILLEPTEHVGGLMSNGLGATDLYGKYFGGLPLEFFQKVNTFYGGAAGKAVYNFEPHVAEQIFTAMLSEYSNIKLTTGAPLASVSMAGTTISGLQSTNGINYVGKEYVDASYTGDLIAAANVSFIVGRESSSEYNEHLAGVGNPIQLGSVPIDPYVVPGNAGSGLIAHVFPDTLGVPGTADSAVMAYNYRLCVSSDPADQIPFSVPANYDATEFELLGRLASNAKTSMTSISDFFGQVALPNRKFDLNNSGPMSTDEVEQSFAYPEGSSSLRLQIEAEQKRYILALMYFLKTDARIPSVVQKSVNSIGLCKDEFTDNGGWPRQIYVREARRMIGSYVMTELDLRSKTIIPDSIGIGGYNVDDHFEHVVNNNGAVNWEYRSGTSSLGLYPIPYRSLTPQALQASNLLASVAVSASHVAYDSLRVEVTYMIMGQAAGAAASLAIDANSSVQTVSYSSLQTQLLSDAALLTPPPGTEASDAELTPVSLTFSTQTEQTASSPQTLTLKNPGTDIVTLSSITLGGASPGDFAQTNTCGTSLAPATDCTISVTFDPTAAGSRTASLIISDNSGTQAGSTQTATLAGTGTTSTNPRVISVSPSSGSGSTETFTAIYSDPQGASDLDSVRILFNTSITGVNGCYVTYNPATNALYLENNADKGKLGPLTPGSSLSLSNSQCTVIGKDTSVKTFDNHITVAFAMTFTDSFSGFKNVYLAANNVNDSSGWVLEGSWTP